MPLFLYDCEKCHEVTEELQGMQGEHKEIECPKCHSVAKRVFTKPIMKLNRGFTSYELGKEVMSHEEHNEGKRKERYMTGIGKYLGDNQSPRQEWVDEKQKQEAEKEKQYKREEEYVSKEYEGFYDTVETY